MAEIREFTPPSLGRRAHAVRWIDKAAEPLRFAIAQLVPAECVSLLAGDGGSGKSILLQLAATCVATGRPFLGYAVEQGPAFYITAEDPEPVLHLRQERINAALGLDMREATKQLYALSVADEDFALFSAGQPTELEERLAQEIFAHAIKFVGIDSASLVFDDNEIDRRAVSAFLRRLNRLARRTGCTVVLIAHTSRSSDGSAMRMASGSTAWPNSVRAGMLLKATEDGAAELALLKANYSKDGLKVQLRWTDDGVLLGEEQPSATLASIEQQRDDDVVLTEIKARWGSNLEPLSKSPRAGERYAAAFLARQGRLNQKRAMAAMVRLLDAGRIVNSPRTKRRPEGLKPAEIT